MKIVYFLIVFTTIESYPATSGLLLKEKHKKMIPLENFFVILDCHDTLFTHLDAENLSKHMVSFDCMLQYELSIVY